MLFKLFLFFTIIPIIELAILIKAGSVIGTLNTIIIVVITGLTGAYMVKLEGIGVMYRIRANLSQGIFPADDLIDGLMIFVAGAFLLTPGFITDTAGFIMVFPFSRNIVKSIVKRNLKERLSINDFR